MTDSAPECYAKASPFGHIRLADEIAAEEGAKAEAFQAAKKRVESAETAQAMTSRDRTVLSRH